MMSPPKLERRLADAKVDLKKIGMTLTRTEFDEYRINHIGGSEETAYYTDDLSDAISTAAKMWMVRGSSEPR